MRDGFLPEEPGRGPSHKKRAAILAVSLAFHALVVLWLFYARMTVKILAFGGDVQEVHLAPPPPVTFPGPIEEYVRNTPSPREFELGTRRAAKRAAESGPPPGAPGAAAPGRPSGLVPENLMKGFPGIPSSSESLPGGGFALSRRPEEEGGRLIINLLAIPEHVEEAPLGFGGPAFGGRSLRRYTLPGTVGGTGTRGSPGAGGGTGSGQRATAIFESPGYDISPWAAQVIDVIQNHWSIPMAPDVTGQSEVRIAVTIEKDGAFSSFDVTGSADLEVFNAAAVSALRTSEPLPALPADFPAPRLSAVFIFSYHD